MTEVLNGWDVAAMSEAVEGVREQEEAGRLTWRSRVKWDGGFGLDVRTLGIDQLGGTMRRHFTLRGDHPPELLGSNTGPTAIETLLAALGACMAGTFAAQATARGVRIENLDLDVEATIDLNGFFGIRPIAPGISDVKLVYHIRSAADETMLHEILEATKALSPIHDTVTASKPVEARIATASAAAV